MMNTKLSGWLVFLAAAGAADAHEFWIEPQSFHVAHPGGLRIGLWLGERFDGNSFRRNEELIDRFELVGPGGASPVVGLSGAKTSFARVEQPGIHIVTYQSRPVHHQMAAKSFDAYLRSEGLGHIADLRAQRSESQTIGRERFSRCAKSLICAGESAAIGFDRVVGLPLEIVPMTNPLDNRLDAIRVRVTFEGQPAAGARLVAVTKHAPNLLEVVTTDKDGIAVVRIDRPGVWMLTTIHMRSVDDDDQSDWESFWASLTFERDEDSASVANRSQ